MREEIIQKINAVLRTLDNGIEVRGAKNAGNLAACFEILSEIGQTLYNCEITQGKELKKDENQSHDGS